MVSRFLKSPEIYLKNKLGDFKNWLLVRRIKRDTIFSHVVVRNPVPREVDTELWVLHQSRVVYRGQDFIFRIGPFLFRIKQLSKAKLTELIESVINQEDDNFLYENVIGDTRLTKTLLKSTKGTTFFENNVTLEAVKGLISEFHVFCTETKKKTSGIDLKGVIQRDRRKLSMSSPKAQLSENQKMWLGTGFIKKDTFTS